MQGSAEQDSDPPATPGMGRVTGLASVPTDVLPDLRSKESESYRRGSQEKSRKEKRSGEPPATNVWLTLLVPLF